MVEVRNEADQLIYATESSLKEHKETLEGDVVSKIEAGVKGLNEAKDDEAATPESIRAAIDQLNQASHELTKKIYEDASKNQAGPESTKEEPANSAGSTSSDQEDNVVDADFEVKE